MDYTRPNDKGGEDFVPPPSKQGEWSLWSVQRTLPVGGKVGSALFNANHNYVAIVDPKGTIQQEFHGTPSPGPDKGFTMFGPKDSNYLRVTQYDGNEYDANHSIINTQQLFSGSPEEMQSRFKSGYDAASDAVNANHTLYNGASLWSPDSTLNSNSVWYTALKGMGYQDADSLAKGSFKAPGSSNDLRTIPSNNTLFLNNQEKTWRPNPAFDNPFSPPQQETTPAAAPDKSGDASGSLTPITQTANSNDGGGVQQSQYSSPAIANNDTSRLLNDTPAAPTPTIANDNLGQGLPQEMQTDDGLPGPGAMSYAADLQPQHSLLGVTDPFGGLPTPQPDGITTIAANDNDSALSLPDGPNLNVV